MTNSSNIRNFNLHEFLKTKRRIMKYAKKTKPNNNNMLHCYGDEITTATTNSDQKVDNVLFENCSGSSTLRDHMNLHCQLYHGLPEFEVRRYTRDIVHALHYIHCNARYVHGDINPTNIQLFRPDGKDSYTAQLAGFGLARKLTTNVVCDDEIRGVGPYTSPEVARDGYPDWPADIWALGCVVIEMMMGKLNYENDFEYDDVPINVAKKISVVGKDFIRKCMARSPYKRRPIWLLVKHPFVCF